MFKLFGIGEGVVCFFIFRFMVFDCGFFRFY